jgi:HprK-related kinase A
MNWCVASLAHNYVMLHCATLERGGKVMILPGMPGAGKSTLCAALVHRGWRLLSDEFGLLRTRDMVLMAMPRPISLKNESISVIREFAPEARIGPRFYGTAKGTVAHVVPPVDQIARAKERAPPGLIVVPQWGAGIPLDLIKITRTTAFVQLASNAFNYELRGADAFQAISQITRECGLYSLRYSNLDDAITILSELA